ncbi:MAG: TetR/AcrR family transcriptional regulator [Nocardioides sp.]|jgi:AcrR family transcriptional regulator
MPRITAPTVAEHHAKQRRALLDAARDLLAETGAEPSMAAVARRAGLARSSIYQYFSSPPDMLAAVVGDVLPAWADRVRAHVEAAATPAERVWAYVEANLELFASPEQAVAQALSRVVEPQVLQRPMEDFHRRLQVPLRDALTAWGEPEVEAIAEIIDAMIVRAARDAAPETAATRLRRLLEGYLRD